MPSRSLDPDTVREVVDSVARALEAVPRALEQQLSAVEVPLPAPATPGRLVELVRSLREAPAQVDLLRRLLAGVAEQGARAALFVLRDGRLVGWEGTRFDDEPELAGDLSGRALPEDSPAVRRVLDSAGTVPCTVGGDAPVPDFGQTLRGEAWLVPLRVLDRLAAVLYVDPAGTEAPDLHAIEVLVEVAGAAVERLAAARARRVPAAPPGATVPRNRPGKRRRAGRRRHRKRRPERPRLPRPRARRPGRKRAGKPVRRPPRRPWRGKRRSATAISTPWRSPWSSRVRRPVRVPVTPAPRRKKPRAAKTTARKRGWRRAPRPRWGRGKPPAAPISRS